MDLPNYCHVAEFKGNWFESNNLDNWFKLQFVGKYSNVVLLRIRNEDVLIIDVIKSERK